MSTDDRRLIVQAHVLRYSISLIALVHGPRPPRSATKVVKILWYSVVLSFVILAAVLLTKTVIELIHQPRRR